MRWSFVAVATVLTVDQAVAIAWPASHDGLAAKVIYDTCIITISVLALLRATRPVQRGPWLLVALGLAAWTAGDVVYTIMYWGDDEVPYPSWADAGYVLFAPLVLAGVLWASRGNAEERPRSLWADGVAAALAVGAVGAALVLLPVLEDGGEGLGILVNAAYPVGDLALLALTVGTLARMGWQVQRRAMLLVLGVTAFYVTDSIYLVGTVQGWYAVPNPIDMGWWIGLLAIAVATWQPPPRRYEEHDDERLRLVVMPLVFSTMALGVLLAASVGSVHWLALVLATGSLLAVMVRLMLTFSQNVTMLRSSRVEASTDPLTGLGNRRELGRELARRLRDGAPDPFELVLFDLDGFKHYNDSYGHPAGDALLQRLGQRLVDHVAPAGHAFRVGGDEFCALLPQSLVGAHAAAATLVEEGDGFHIGASYGSICLPEETDDPVEAIRVADQRLYANKHAKRGSAGRQTADALLRALAAHQPDLYVHSDDVADLAEATARELGLAQTDVDQVRQTGELHDIGKLGVPSEILHKPGRLDEQEWAYVKRHTLIGERILGGAPALLTVARLVRATHERWDGKGYPDAVAGDAIPLASRIVAVADAYEAMTTTRPYSNAKSPEAALAELRRCAGAQFDPAVVDAFGRIWLGEQGPAPASAADTVAV